MEKPNTKKAHTVLFTVLIILTVACIVAAAVTPFAEETENITPLWTVSGFNLYEPPNHIEVVRYDYMKDLGGSPSTNNQPTAYPTQYQPYPYHAVFFGANREPIQTPQGYMSCVYVLFSKKPILSNVSFKWLSTRGDWGQIQASIPLYGDDMLVAVRTYGGVTTSDNTVYIYNFGQLTGGTFTFDFFYINDSNVDFPGMSALAEPATYDWVLHCGHNRPGESGGGGQSTSESSAGGGTSSGGSSSGGSSGGSSNSGNWWGSNNWSSSSEKGPGADWDKSSSTGSNPGEYPWEKDSNIPDLDWEPSVSEYPGGEVDDEGEKGDTWELPGYTVPGLPMEDGNINIPSMPDVSWPELSTPEFSFPGFPNMPDTGDPPVLEYQPEGSGGWPPPFPGTG